MSRIGKHPIAVPAGVEVKVDGSTVTVKGPKGTLTKEFKPSMSIAVDGGFVTVTRPDDEKENRALHGLTRTLIHNMIEGVTNGFKKELDVNGVGYRVQKQGKDLIMNLGYSHQVIVSDTEDIKIESVRSKRPPEPYKGKGIKYTDETIRRKEGKAGKGKK